MIEMEGETRLELFGHPNIIYLPSNTSGENLYETVDRVVPCNSPYSIVLTDGQVSGFIMWGDNIIHLEK